MTPPAVIANRAQMWTIFASFLVATSFPVGAAIASDMDSVVLTLLRFTLATIMFAPLVAWKDGLPLPSLSDFAGYALISFTLVGFFWGMFEALRYTSALNTATIFTLTPVIAAGISAVILRERLKKRSLFALGMGLVGAVWVIFRGDFSALLSMDLNQGDAIFLAATLSMGIYGPLVKRLHRGQPMSQMSFWILATGTMWLLLLALPRLGDVSWTDVPHKVYWGILYLSFFTTLITFFIFQWSTLIIGPTKVMSYTYLNPIFVVLFGIIQGNTMPSAMLYPGLILVVSATIILQMAHPKQA